MTEPTPTNAGRVEPVYGWAVVMPDGTTEQVLLPTELGKHSVSRFGEEQSVQRETGRWWDPADPAEGWKHAYRAGWRVIRVQISPAFDQKDMQA